MNTRRTTQLIFTFSVIFALCASSVAACVCHDAARPNVVSPENHSSAAHSHTDSHAPRAAHTHHRTNADDEFFIGNFSDDCCCVRPAPKYAVKSETLKIEKQPVVYQPKQRFAPVRFALTAGASARVTTVDTRFSGDHRRLKSPRAPPRS